MGIIDTHSHLQLASLNARRPAWLAAAAAAGVESMLLCPGEPAGFAEAAGVAHAWGLGYALGIHPLAVPDVDEAAGLARLREAVAAAMADPYFIGIGEVGIDGWEPGIDQAKAERIFVGCLKIAREFDLPLSVHVRRSASRILKYFRQLPPPGGVMHAFNGSAVERDAFLRFGMKLGFGGAATYAGSLRIRRWLAQAPRDAWVLETDSPDMPSSPRRDAWEAERLKAGEAAAGPLLTEPADILDALRAAAELRGLTPEAAAAEARRNALAAFPRFEALLARPDAFARRFAAERMPSDA